MHGADHGSTTVRRAVPALTALAVLGALAARADAHVEAAIDENNRYLKLTPMGDRVRLAYTVFIGQRPGEQLRRRLDGNRDRQVSDGEAAIYGEELARHIRGAVAIDLDGRPAAVAWTTPSVGLGTPSVTGGALSVDVVGWLCVGGGDDHTLVLRDTVVLDKPGETEVRLEDGPGVHFAPGTTLERTWTGGGGLLTEGLTIAWRTDGDAPRPDDGRCRARNAGAPRWWPWGVIGILVALFLAGGAAYARQRKPNEK